MLLSSFPHQQRITNTLQKSLEAGKISHANLFIGADENEMETMAAAFAQILYCQNPPSRSPQSGRTPLSAASRWGASARCATG